MKVLVTGGAGFIGSTLCDFLIKKSYSVVIVDNLSTGSLLNLSNVLEEVSFYEEKIDFFNFDKIEAIDAVVHLAAQPSVPISVTDFGNSSSSNLLGTINVIEYCRLNRVPLIYASSSAVYGNLPLGNDNGTQIDLLSPYATDKYVMELYTKITYELHQLSSVGLRFFNVYGPRQDPSNPYSGVISIFVERILEDKNIIINGGQQTRDFVYVNDVVSVIYKAINLAIENTICEVSNVLTGRSTSIDNLANKIMEIAGKKVEKKYQNLPIGDPEQSDGTTEKMAKLFDMELSSFSELEYGILKTIKFIRND